MLRGRFKKTFKWLKIILLVYLIIGIAAYFLQDKFLLHPKKLPPEYVFNFPQPFKEVNLAVTDKKNISLIQFTVPDSLRKGIVLYFHGNKQNIERYAVFASNFTRNKYEVWMMDYPGFGKTTGDFSEEAVYVDAATVYQMARSVVSKDSIIFYGKSLGTGVAAQLASVKDCKRLILETPYYSMEALLNTYLFMYPVSRMTNYHFPTHQYFDQIEVPITIFHGTADELIPYRQAKRLQAQKPGTELVTIEKGKHNNLGDFPLFHQKLDSLME